MTDSWLIAVPLHNGRPKVDAAMKDFRALRRPRPHVEPYEKPSDGSTLVLLDEPSSMTGAQVVSMALFNSKPRYQ